MGDLKKSAELLEQEKAVNSTEALNLPADVAAKYTVARGIVRVFLDTQTSKLVDLNKITLETAEKLAARGILKSKG